VWFPFRPLSAHRWADAMLLLMFVAIAFLLGCYEMGDSDVWWHLRGGEWTLENGKPPQRDPFTFGSADRVWVDIHWAYEVLLALAYRAGGAGALVLLAAAVGAVAFLVCLTARRRGWPVSVAILAWAPALMLLAFRLDPRPEILSLLFLGCYLAILWRAEDRPALVWLLPVLQVLWVNVQGLFIFGPILLALFVTSHAADQFVGRWRGTVSWGVEQRRWWRHVGLGCCGVLLACLVNPYGLDGARFPFDLFPKVAVAGNIYKRYIDELQSPADYVREATRTVAGSNWFFMAFHFLLLLVPLSFLYPSLWRAAQQSPEHEQRVRPSAHTPCPDSREHWIAGFLALVCLIGVGTLTVSGRGMPGLLVVLGDNLPLLLPLVGGIAALALRKRSAWAAALAGTGGVALGAWAGCLETTLLGDGRHLLFGADSPLWWQRLLVVAGAAATGLVLRWGASLFRILLAAAFIYLGLQALQNWSRFALVAGTVVVWNLGEWAAGLSTVPLPRRSAVPVGWAVRAALAGGLAIWIAALLTDRFYIHTGEPRHLAFREQPFEFAHEAATFAGQSGMPRRALVYGLGQTGVYVYHNAPHHKPYMDGRLEMPDRATFETYIAVEQWLRDGDPRWERAVAVMGDPLLLLEHQNNHAAEAHLLMHPRWRCVYCDALACVFVRDDAASDFPTLDFAARHFHQRAQPSVPPLPGSAFREEKALFNLAASLPPSPTAAWRWRVPVLLVALDRAQMALDAEPTRADVWVALGNIHWRLDPDSRTAPPSPTDPWSLERSIYLAQATYSYRRALELQADSAPAWRYMAQAFQVRGMVDSQIAAEKRSVHNEPKATDHQRDQATRRCASLAAESLPDPPGRLDDLPAVVTNLLQRHRPEAAGRLIQEADPRGVAAWPWRFADQVAGLYLHLGRPGEARQVWERAVDCPSAGLRLCRVASTYWVERDFDSALRHFEAARRADPQLAEACWGLAMLQLQLGDAGSALQACRAARQRSLSERQSADIDGLARLLTSANGAQSVSDGFR
jgi:tetratricopeptide (TPR) repeat protein